MTPTIVCLMMATAFFAGAYATECRRVVRGAVRARIVYRD